MTHRRSIALRARRRRMIRLIYARQRPFDPR